MLIKLNEAVGFPFSTRDPTTGSATDADSLPTAIVETAGATVGGTDIAVVKKAATTGQYTVTLTTAPGQFTAGVKYDIRVTATVAGVTDQTPIATFEVSVETHGIVIDKSISSVETNLAAVGGPGPWTSATTVDVTSFNGDTNSVSNLVSVLLGTGHTDDVRLSAAQLRLENDLPNITPLLINATYSGVGVQNAVGILAADGDGMVVSGSSNDIVADITGSVVSVADPASIWAHTDTESATKTAFQVICMAAAGAGAGTVDVSVAPGVTRNETTRYLDGSDAYITAADENGNRTLVNLNP